MSACYYPALPHHMARKTARSSPRLCERVVVAVTGSVGALWTAQFILHLRTNRYVRDVTVVMSEHATKFVGMAAMRAVSGAPVLAGLFDPDAPFAVGHVEVSQGAGALVVMPATANIIGKAAAGVADDAVSSAILGADCPVIFVPNMNPRMWTHPIVRRNVGILKDAGYRVIPPTTGIEVSTLRSREGGMPPFDDIVRAIRAAVK
jgi:phosphopantothenoylcysteine decarboxylase/phosphopantothenate--cysteine ligase